MGGVEGESLSLPRQKASEVFPMSTAKVTDAFHEIVSFPIGLQREAQVVDVLSPAVLPYVDARTFSGYSPQEADGQIRPSYRLGVLAAHRTARLSAKEALTLQGVGALPPEVTMPDILRHGVKVRGSEDGGVIEAWNKAWEGFEKDDRYKDFADRMGAAAAVAPLETAFKGGVVDYIGWINARAARDRERDIRNLYKA